MRVLWVLALGLLAPSVALLTSGARSESKMDLLAGVRSIKIVVEDLGSDAEKCGISKNSIKSAAIVSLKNSTKLTIGA